MPKPPARRELHDTAPPTNREVLLAPSPKAMLVGDRAVASYKVNSDVKRQFARFAKWYNRDRDPSEEIEIGMLAQEALEDLMHKYGYTEAAP